MLLSSRGGSPLKIVDIRLIEIRRVGRDRQRRHASIETLQFRRLPIRAVAVHIALQVHFRTSAFGAIGVNRNQTVRMSSPEDIICGIGPPMAEVGPSLFDGLRLQIADPVSSESDISPGNTQ